MAKQKIETSIEINGIDVVAYPLVESDHVTFENGMSINEMIKGDVVTPVVTHEETSFKVGKGDSDVSSSIVDSSVGEMAIKGQTYQNILPEPSLRNSMTNGKTMQKFNEGYDNVNVVDGVGKSAVLKGQTLVNLASPVKAEESSFKKITYENGVCVCEAKTDEPNWYQIRTPVSGMIKTSTKYLLRVNVLQNSLSTFLSFTGNHNFSSFESSSQATIQPKSTGLFNIILTSKSSFETQQGCDLFIQFGREEHSGNKISFTYQIFEYQDGMENWDIPYFEGMKSVQSPSLASVGKNLFDKRAYSDLYFDSESLVLKAGNNYARSIVFKVNKNESYIVSGVDKLLAVNNSNVIRVLFTRDTPNIGNVSVRLNNLAGAIVAPENGYILLGNLKESGRWTDEEWINAVDTIQIEQGSVATTYEPHKSNTLTAPSDLTLRGIGDVCDTLDLVSGEKIERILEVVFDGSNDESWVLSGSQPKDTSFVRFDIIINKRFMVGANGLILCDKIPYLYIHEIGPRNIAQECVSVHSVDEGAINLIIKKEKLTEVNVTKFKEWLSKNPLTVQCKLKTPTTTKVDLSSSGNWEKVVLDGSENWNKFQIDSMLRHSQFYIRIEDKLAYSKPVCDSFVVGFRQVTDSGGEFVAGDGGNGKNIWVNILNSRLVSLDVNGFKAFLRENPITVWYQTTTHKDSTQVKQPLSFSNGHIQLSSEEGSLIPSLDYEIPTSNSYHMDLMKTDTNYTVKSTNPSGMCDIGDVKGITIPSNYLWNVPSARKGDMLLVVHGSWTNPMILEGDVTDKAIPYFKGVKSAFEGEDKIEVLSVGKNLYPYRDLLFIPTEYNWYDAVGTAKMYGDIGSKSKCRFPLKKGTYYFSYGERNNIEALQLVSDNETIILKEWSGAFTLTEETYLTLRIKPRQTTCTESVTITNIQITENAVVTSYEPYKSNITKIPLSSPLRSLPNGVCDEVILDRENNKVKVIQRVGYEVFDGSEGWKLSPTFSHYGYNQFNLARHKITSDINDSGMNSRFIRIPSVWSSNIEGFSYQQSAGNGRAYAWIKRKQLNFPQVSQLKADLHANPLVTTYPLETPIITEIDLDGYPYIYKDGHIFLNSEIAPTTTMKYSINQSHQIESQNGDLIRHEKEINYLYTLIAKYVNVQYESTLLNLDLELSRA